MFSGFNLCQEEMLQLLHLMPKELAYIFTGIMSITVCISWQCQFLGQCRGQQTFPCWFLKTYKGALKRESGLNCLITFFQWCYLYYLNYQRYILMDLIFSTTWFVVKLWTVFQNTWGQLSDMSQIEHFFVNKHNLPKTRQSSFQCFFICLICSPETAEKSGSKI